MGLRAFLWGSIALTGALLAVSAPWSRDLPSCNDVPAAQRERVRIAGRCEGSAPIVQARPGARGAAKKRPVPDLRGRLFNLNDERLGRFIVEVDYRPSVQRRDWVIDQVPRPPASLPEGSDLRVVLSDGGLVRVPDVRGNFARALTLLYRAGLSWSTGEPATGAVVSQVPAPGATVKAGTPIALRLGPVALAPESTKPDVTPAPPPSSAPSTSPAPPPATAPAPSAPRAPATPPAERTAPAMTMPDLQGLIFDVARQRLPGINVERVHRAGTEAGGTVIGQSPPAGTALAPRTAVRLVLSDGSLIRVPRVRSFTIDEARQRLAPGELRVVISSVPSESPSGTVISQQPAEGQVAPRGSAVRLNVSSGPAATRVVAVPNLVGSTLERSRAQLGRLQVERSERPAREPAGTILEQTPAPGTTVEPGSAVSVVVSSGGRPEVIDLANVVGQNADAATNALSEFRLERETVESVEPAGRVLGQEPAAGASVPPGSTVRLRVSDGSLVIAPSLAKMTLAEARDAARAAGVALPPDIETRDASARVTAQQPAPGTPIRRGAPLQLTVEERSLPIAVPPAARDAWTRASDFAIAQPPRNLAMAAVVLLALLALLMLALRRRSRTAFAPVEPVFAPTRSRDPEPRAAASAPASAPERSRQRRTPPTVSAAPASGRPSNPAQPSSPAPVPAPPASGRPVTAALVSPPPASAPRSPRARGAAPESPAIVQRRKPAPPRVEAPPVVSPPVVTPPAVTPAVMAPPVVARPVVTPPVVAPPVVTAPVVSPPVVAPPVVAPPVVTPPVVTPPVMTPPVMAPPVAARPVGTPPVAAPPVVAPPVVARPIVARPAEPLTFAATARLEADPSKTVASNAAPRGPEIRITARLDPGDSAVRELPTETAPDEMTEETK